jgi:hypothetical protein
MFNRSQAHSLASFLHSVGIECHVEYFGENLDLCSVEIDNDDRNLTANIESLQDLILIGNNRPEVLEATLP